MKSDRTGGHSRTVATNRNRDGPFIPRLKAGAFWLPFPYLQPCGIQAILLTISDVVTPFLSWRDQASAL
jgi:hypothetical protein